MSIRYTINVNGTPRTLSSQDLLTQFAEASGYDAVGISSDGTRGIFRTPQGIQEIPFHETFPQGAITDFVPDNAKPAANMMKYRLAIDNFSDPDLQDAYLKTVASKDFGQTNPVIMGKGSDRFLWDPGQASWVALTNKEGLDTSDIASGAVGLGKGIASGLGAVGGGALAAFAGLPAGPAAIGTGIAGAAAGGAAGSALADAAQAGIQSALDPAYGQTLGSVQNYLDKEGSGIGARAALSGALGGGGAILGKALTPVASSLASGGNVVRGAGAIGKGAGQVLGSDAGRMGLQMGLDPTGISGVGAIGGFAKDIAAPVAQGATKGMDFVRSAVANMRGLEGPVQRFAGETFEQTAKNLPNVGNFVRGVEAVGGGLEKVGRGVENVISGGIKGAGRALELGGKGMQAAGKYSAKLEPGAWHAGARAQDGARSNVSTISNAPQQTIEANRGLDGGYQQASLGNPGSEYNATDSLLSNLLASRGNASRSW